MHRTTYSTYYQIIVFVLMSFPTLCIVRVQVDKKGVGCSAYDIAISPKYTKTLREEPAFMNFFLQVVYEGLAAKFDVSYQILVNL